VHILQPVWFRKYIAVEERYPATGSFGQTTVACFTCEETIFLMYDTKTRMCGDQPGGVVRPGVDDQNFLGAYRLAIETVDQRGKKGSRTEHRDYN